MGPACCQSRDRIHERVVSVGVKLGGRTRTVCGIVKKEFTSQERIIRRASFYQLEDRSRDERFRDTCNPKEMVFGH